MDNIEKLQKLKQLLDEGIITREEFEENKARLLFPKDNGARDAAPQAPPAPAYPSYQSNPAYPSYQSNPSYPQYNVNMEAFRPVVQSQGNNILEYSYIGVIAAALCSFGFLALNYVRIGMISDGVSRSYNLKGYTLLTCLDGTLWLSGVMVILLMIVSAAAIVTAMIGLTGRSVKKSVLKTIILVEDIIYLVVTIVPQIHIRHALKELTGYYNVDVGVGIGCYLNLAVAVIMIVMYFSVFSKNLDD